MGCSSSHIELEDQNHSSSTKPLTLKAKKSQSNIVTNLEDIKINQGNFINKRKNIKEDYDFLGSLGEGSFGVVHKVRLRATKQLRAVKIVPRDLIKFQEDSNEFLKLF